MSDLILHHYPTSPFAEKIRLILGYKQLAWDSVFIPMIMPKPDLTALTGGYRKTPVLQIGSDIYCDTALICDVLEHLAPTPTLFPDAVKGVARIVTQWADTALFTTAMAYNFQPAGVAQVFAGAPAEGDALWCPGGGSLMSAVRTGGAWSPAGSEGFPIAVVGRGRGWREAGRGDGRAVRAAAECEQRCAARTGAHGAAAGGGRRRAWRPLHPPDAAIPAGHRSVRAAPPMNASVAHGHRPDPARGRRCCPNGSTLPPR